jgi:hypothetical protein
MLRRARLLRFQFGEWGPSHKFDQGVLGSRKSTPLFKLGSNIHMYANKESAWEAHTTDRFHGAKRVKELFKRFSSDLGVKYFFTATVILLIGATAFFCNQYDQLIVEHGLAGPKKKKYRSRLTVVLDVDETILSYGDKAFRMKAGMVPRPYLTELLDYLAQIDAEVILWSACTDRYMKQVLALLDPNGDRISHYLTRSNKWFTRDAYYEKNIVWLKRDLANTIIIENRAVGVRNCNANALLVDDFIRGEFMEDGKDSPINDKALRIVRDIIADLEVSGRPVNEYLQDTIKRNKEIKEIPCHLAIRQLPDEIARGVFFFVGDKFKPSKN